MSRSEWWTLTKYRNKVVANCEDICGVDRESIHVLSGKSGILIKGGREPKSETC